MNNEIVNSLRQRLIQGVHEWGRGAKRNAGKNTWLPTLNKIECMTTVGICAIERA